MSSSVHPSIFLGYSVPDNSLRKFDSVDVSTFVDFCNLSNQSSAKSAPVYQSEPLYKSFLGGAIPKDDPLSTILAASKKLVALYAVKLYYSEEYDKRSDRDNNSNMDAMSPSKIGLNSKHSTKMTSRTPKSAATINLIPTHDSHRKRVRSGGIAEDDDFNSSALDLQNNTPVPNKTIYFGSTSKPISRKSSQLFGTISTPSNGERKLNSKISMEFSKNKGDWSLILAQAQNKLKVKENSKQENNNNISNDVNNDNKIKSNENDFKAIQIPGNTELNFGASTPTKEREELEFLPLEEDEDQLACHADKIMRMAVDLTMLGSSYNASLSFNCSLNDSMNGIASRRKQQQIEIFDDNDPEKSLLELRKQKWNMLSRDRAVKVDINEDDLKNILSDD